MDDFLTSLDAWVWRYRENTRNYPGLHFTGREPACEALIRCLDLLIAEGAGARRTIPLRRLDPSDEARISGGRSFVAFERLLLQLSSATAELQQLFVHYAKGRAVIEFTPASLLLLRKGFADVRNGYGDYAIAPDGKAGPIGIRDHESLVLWFWPCFGDTRPVGGARSGLAQGGRA